jgi:hypothetical protein
MNSSEFHLQQLVEKTIPAFEKVHGPGYQVLIVVSAFAHSFNVIFLLSAHKELAQ